MKSRIQLYALTLITGMLTFSCGDDNNSLGSGGAGGDWLVPVAEVFDGGPGKDGIPALMTPPLLEIGQANYLNDTSLVIAVRFGSEIRGYPHSVLDWHEIANDKIGVDAFAVTYCPLTGTAIGWNRTINGRETSFGVSGLLYNTNLMPYDRLTNSTWSQMRLDAVNGELIRTKAETFQLIETDWRTFKQMFPTAKVLSNNTGISRPYGQYPYGDYRTNQNRLLFPIDFWDNRLPGKERVVGVRIGSASKVYRFSSFGSVNTAINDTLQGVDVVAIGNASMNFGMVYERRAQDGAVLTFTGLDNELPAVMIDDEGNKWDLFGQAISGPRIGEQLPQTTSYIAYWFAWGAFYRGASIHGQ